MKNTLSALLVLVLIALSVPAQAQFRTERRTANKEYELGAYNLAVESYKKALARRPDDLESLSRIADSYRMLNQMQQAHTYYQQAVRDRRVEKNTVLEHAHVLKALGRYEEAKQWYLAYARDFDVVVGNHYAQSCDFAISQKAEQAGFTTQVASINSPVSDFGPTMPSPGQLVFNSSRTSAGAGFTGQASNKPYVSSVGPDGSLQPGFALTTGYTAQDGNVGPVSYTPDGLQVIFTKNNFTAGTRMIPEAGIELSLMIADVNPQGQWINVRPLPFNGTNFSTGFGTFSADGNAIYFSSDRDGGFGGYDVYRVRRQGNTWETVPENLGTVVNSVGHEITPFFDGASLFFSSNWHHGLGAYDVFRAEMSGDRAATLYHMGAAINSPRDDIGFVFNPTSNVGYVASNRIGGNGQEDIYRVGRASSNRVLLVQNALNGTPVPNAAIDFTACGGQIYASDMNGRYVFEPTQGLACDIVITATGYQAVRLPLQTITPDAQNVARISLTPLTGSTTPPPTTGNVDLTTLPQGTYGGYVTDAQNGRAVPQANVQLTQRTTGATANVMSNAQGIYILNLDPYNTYDLVVTAPGYETVRRVVTNNDGSNKNLLGNVTLLPAQSPQPGTITGGNTGGGTTGGGTTGPTYTQTNGYAVQLASLSKSPDLGNFSNVSNLGRVYTVNTGSAYKVRMGVYATKAEAAAAAASAKAAGYTGAFVTADSGASAFATGGGGTTTTGGYTPPVPQPPTPQPTTSGGYKVQIGAYGQPQNFDRNKASQLGTIESRTRGNLTLFMVGGLYSLEEARRVQSRAIQLGYPGAFVLQDVNGQLIKL